MNGTSLLIVIEISTFLTPAIILLFLGLFYPKYKIRRRSFLIKNVLWPTVASVIFGLCYLFTYFGSRLITNTYPPSSFFEFNSPLDAKIPLVSPFIIFYLMCYLIIPLSSYYILLIGGGEKGIIKFIFVILIVCALSFIFFVTVPNEVPHPWTNDNHPANMHPLDKALMWMYDNDQASNGMPSLHNAFAWILVCFAVFSIKIQWRYIVPTTLLAIMVSLSTLFCKEHYIADVIFTIPLVAFIAYLVIKRNKLSDRTFDFFDSKLNKR
jgi:hypothetical protein